MRKLSRAASETSRWLAAPGLLVVALFLAATLTILLASFTARGAAITLKQYVRVLSDPLYLDALWRSFRVALYTTPITLVLAYPVAYVMARASGAVRVLLTITLVVQFFTSYVIRAYALILVLGNNGVINRALLALGVVESPVRLMYNELGVALSLVLVPLPFMVFPIYSSLTAIEPNLEVAATSLGADRLRTFWNIVVPLSLPGALAGVVLVFLFNLTAYIMPGMLGGGYFDMIANVIYDQAMEVRDVPFAAALSMVLLLATVVVVYVTNRWGSRLAERSTE